MKQLIAVAFHPEAPLEAFDFQLDVMTTARATYRLLNCKSVQETSYGFLQLVPFVKAQNLSMTMFVPASYVAWMAQSENDSTIGFLQAMK